MNIMNINILRNAAPALLMAAITLTACSDNEDNKPSLADTDRMEELLDHDIADIENFKQKYGTYLLYDFDDLLDFAYQFEEASAWRNATVTHLDKADAPAAVKFLEGTDTEPAFFNCYTDEMKTTQFPRKILLCKTIESSEELGLSQPSQSRHTAVANMNSMSIAGLDAASLAALDTQDKRTDFFRQLNYILLAGYIVNSKANLFVNNNFFEYSKAYYNTLISEDRKPASNFRKTGDPDVDADGFYAKFYARGLFFPLKGDEETYYDSATNDLISFIKAFVFMDEDTAKELREYETMTEKMRMLLQDLESMGVKTASINPVAAQYFGE